MNIDIKNRTIEIDDGFYVTVVIVAFMAALAFGVPRCSESIDKAYTERMTKCVEHGGAWNQGNCVGGLGK